MGEHWRAGYYAMLYYISLVLVPGWGFVGGRGVPGWGFVGHCGPVFVVLGRFF